MRKYLLLALLWPWIAIAQEDTNAIAKLAKLQNLESGLKFQDGKVTLKNGLATLSLPEGFRYLSPDDAETVLVKMWGNPPGHGQDTLGMIVPTDSSLLSRDSWAVVIEYEEDGYVKDSDADSINYTKLLKQMQEAVHDANKERQKNGYRTMELIGWAAPPHYDKESHKLYWAKEIKFGTNQVNTLNYNIRVLGRQGVLILNAVASMRNFDVIDKKTPDVVKMVEFNEGNRYADFNSKTDRTAAYGLAALVAGGIAAKAGFFKVLWLGLLAAKKFVIIGVIAVAGFVKKLFSRGESSSS